MKPVKRVPYPYYFLNKIVIPIDDKKEIKSLTDFENNFLLDLLFPVSPNVEKKSNNK